MKTGTDLIQVGHEIALSSPYVYLGDKSKSEIIAIYDEAVDFGLSQLGKSKRFEKDTLLNQFIDQAFQEDQSANIVIVFDYLIIDYIYQKY